MIEDISIQRTDHFLVHVEKNNIIRQQLLYFKLQILEKAPAFGVSIHPCHQNDVTRLMKYMIEHFNYWWSSPINYPSNIVKGQIIISLNLCQLKISTPFKMIPYTDYKSLPNMNYNLSEKGKR